MLFRSGIHSAYPHLRHIRYTNTHAHTPYVCSFFLLLLLADTLAIVSDTIRSLCLQNAEKIKEQEDAFAFKGADRKHIRDCGYTGWGD